MKSFKLTVSTQNVLLALIKNREREMYGLEISTTTGVPIGSLYAILRRLKDADVITDRWEKHSEHAQARPPRHYYRIRTEALQEVRQLLESGVERRAAMAKNNT
jgi:DNA-binding PadR family transcriptional regulator